MHVLEGVLWRMMPSHTSLEIMTLFYRLTKSIFGVWRVAVTGPDTVKFCKSDALDKLYSTKPELFGSSVHGSFGFAGLEHLVVR